ISPDIDTVTYTLAGAIDPERGWGLRDETWRAMEALRRFEDVRPAGSSAAPTWVNLGDQDLATHFYRTARLAEGASLTTVPAEIGRACGRPGTLLPRTDDRVEPRLTIDSAENCESVDSAESGEISFQEYFVQRRHGVPVRSVRFAGVERAELTARARTAI